MHYVHISCLQVTLGAGNSTAGQPFRSAAGFGRALERHPAGACEWNRPGRPHASSCGRGCYAAAAHGASAGPCAGPGRASWPWAGASGGGSAGYCRLSWRLQWRGRCAHSSSCGGGSSGCASGGGGCCCGCCTTASAWGSAGPVRRGCAARARGCAAEPCAVGGPHGGRAHRRAARAAGAAWAQLTCRFRACEAGVEVFSCSTVLSHVLLIVHGFQLSMVTC